MGSRARALFVYTAAASTLGVVVSSCLGATQVTLDVTSANLCGKIKSTAIYVASDPSAANARVQSRSPEAVTTACNGTTIGSLVVTPGSKSGAVVVIAGYGDKSPTDCYEGNYVNCIIARRAFAFVSHTSLRIPIELDVDCLNVPCDEGSSCDHGTCKGAAVDCTTTGSCTDVSGNTVVDAGPMLLPDGAPADEDSGSESDAGIADSGIDGAMSDSGGGFNCGTTAPCCGPDPTSATSPYVVYDCPSATPCAKAQCCSIDMQSSTRTCTNGGPGTVKCATNFALQKTVLCCSDADCADNTECCDQNPTTGPCLHAATSNIPGQCWPTPSGGVDAGACNQVTGPCCGVNGAKPALYHCGSIESNDCAAAQCCITGMVAATCTNASSGLCNAMAVKSVSLCCSSADCSPPATCCAADPDGGACVFQPNGTTPGQCY